MKKKIVYIAHPIGGNVEENLRLIRELVRDINLKRDDVVPFVPYYADCVSLDDSNPLERERDIANNIEIFRSGIINELWLFGKTISKGMEAEIDLAGEMKIQVHCMTKETAEKFKEIYPVDRFFN